MNNDSPRKALLVATLVALVCSILVSVAAVALKPVQLRNQLVERSRNIVALTGLVEPGNTLSDDEILDAVEQLDIRVVDVDTGEFDDSIDAATFDERAAANQPDFSSEIPAEQDVSSLGKRSRYAIVYLVWGDDGLDRLIMPIHGQGMWSTLYGFIALQGDLNTIAAVTFYEQAETAGLGDQITRPQWHSRWVGRQIFDSSGNLRFRISTGMVEDGSSAARHEVDALTGASVTADSVTRIIAYWFGPHGYQPFLGALDSNQPQRAVARRGSE